MYTHAFACSLRSGSHGLARPFYGPYGHRNGEKPNTIDPGIQLSTSHLWHCYLDWLSYARNVRMNNYTLTDGHLRVMFIPHFCVIHHWEQLAATFVKHTKVCVVTAKSLYKPKRDTNSMAASSPKKVLTTNILGSNGQEQKAGPNRLDKTSQNQTLH